MMSGALLFGWGIWTVFGAATLIYWAEIAYDIFAGCRGSVVGCLPNPGVYVTHELVLSPSRTWKKFRTVSGLALIVITVGDWIEYRRIPPVIQSHAKSGRAATDGTQKRDYS